MPPPDYTTWPTETDVIERCTSAGITPRILSVVTSALNGVIRQVAQKTRRQFVAGESGEIRYYDGSGGVELQIADEIVTLERVQILGYVGINGAIPVTAPVLIQEQTLPYTRILLYRGSAPIYAGIYLDRWPQGFSNIEVTGKFGYAATVPEDLWEAVARETAAMMIDEAQNSPRGVIVEKREGDNATKWEGATKFADASHKKFRAIVKQYARPSGQHFRRTKAPMI